MTTAAAASSTARRSRTQLDHYPTGLQRYLSLGIVVLATVVLYYQFYLAGAVAAGTGGQNGILVDYDMSFVYYVNISVVGYILGAVASFASGVADRWGRVNIITGGLFVVALLCLLGIPLADSKIGFALVFGAIGMVEGMILVATPALIRDFSPQLGRASAMGFWTLGPVLGSLVVSIQVSSTSVTTPWHDQYIAAGIVGLVIAVVSAVFLRELSPRLRDQVMVSANDRALVEARALGIDVEHATAGPFRQMLKPDIVLSAFSISVFLIIYYVAVGFFPVYFQTIFGYSQSRANGLGNWIWAFDAGALVLIGILSDRLRVRKPFMVVGAIGAIVMTIIFLTRATAGPDATSYTQFVIILSLLAVFLGVAYAPWMASFTETVEGKNPALAATGLAVWGLTIRIVIAVSVFIVPYVVTTVSALVEDGPRAQALAAQYEPELATAASLSPATAAALQADPTDQATGIQAVSEVSGVSTADVTTDATLLATQGPAIEAAQALSPATASALVSNPTPALQLQAVQEIASALDVAPAEAADRLTALAQIPVTDLLTLQTTGPQVLAAQDQLTALGAVPAADLQLLADTQQAGADAPKQWRNYFWIAVGGEVVFIPLIFLLTGAWSPKEAKRREQEHEASVAAELRRLSEGDRVG